MNKHEQSIQPGKLPLDPESGQPACPVPTEIEIIKVKKVFNECMHTEVQEAVIYGWTTANTTDAQEANCDSVEVENVSCTVLNGDIVRVSYDLEVCATVPLDTGGFERHTTVTTGISKTLRIARAGEEGLGVQCHVFPEALFCFISERDLDTGGVVAVTCCVGILILLKVDAEVQLMIPTYGYPPPPPSCDEFIGECPTTFIPNWPPYPSLGLSSNGNNCKGNKAE